MSTSTDLYPPFKQARVRARADRARALGSRLYRRKNGWDLRDPWDVNGRLIECPNLVAVDWQLTLWAARMGAKA